MKILLFVVVMMAGGQPQPHQIEVESIEECWRLAQSFTEQMEPEMAAKGGFVQSGCVAIFEGHKA